MDGVKIKNDVKNLDITVSEESSEIVIRIKEKGEQVKIGSLKEGEVFLIGKREYVILSQGCGFTRVITKDLLENDMEFDSNTNDWKASSLRRYLNEEFLHELKEAVGASNIFAHIVDLTSNDGLKDYCVSEYDRVSILTGDMYRKYRLVLPKINDWWWLATPHSTPSGCSSYHVLHVYSDGCLTLGECGRRYGVRPYCVLKSSIFVSMP